MVIDFAFYCTFVSMASFPCLSVLAMQEHMKGYINYTEFEGGRGHASLGQERYKQYNLFNNYARILKAHSHSMSGGSI
jgi:hypothetical protein